MFLTYQGKRTELTAARLKGLREINDFGMQLLGGVSDQASYDMAKRRYLQMLAQAGIDPSQAAVNLPPQYSPEAIHTLQMQGMDTSKQLAAVARIVLGAWDADPDLVRVLVREVARSPQLGSEIEELEHAFAALERIVRRGQERGELRPELDPRIAALILYGALEEILTALVFERMPAGDGEVERATETALALLSDGLAVD